MMLPHQATLKQFADSLIIDFPNDDIPVLQDESKWENWGNQLIQCNSFYLNNAPPTHLFNDWSSWAKAVFYSMVNLP